MNKIFLSLGSNLGDAKKNIQYCVQCLYKSKYIQVERLSSFYRTSPMYNSDQADFINCVIDIKTSLKPLELLRHTQSIEKKIGRNSQTERNQPRKIDIDILTYNDEIIDEENLKIPHPKMNERKFVLVPLFELAGNLSTPGSFTKVKDLIKNLDKNSDKIKKCNYKINEKNLSYSC